MVNGFRIILPKDTPDVEVKAARKELERISGVEDTTAEQVYGLDPVSIMVWVKLASAIVGAAGGAVPLIKQVVEMFRARNLDAVEIEIPGGGRVKVSSASAADIERLVRAAATAASPAPDPRASSRTP